jgi:hypothetical protein
VSEGAFLSDAKQNIWGNKCHLIDLTLISQTFLGQAPDLDTNPVFHYTDPIPAY